MRLSAQGCRWLVPLVLIVCGATGCDEMPVIQGLTSEEEKPDPVPVTPKPVRVPGYNQASSQRPTQPVTPPKRTPEEVLADFRELEPDQIDDSHLATLAGLEEGLEVFSSLDLSGSKVTDSGLEHLVKFTGLRELHLNNVAITAAGLASVAKVETLESLSLAGAPHRGTGLTSFDDGLAQLEQMHHLRELNLTGVNLTDAGLAPVGTLVHLERLVLNRTSVSDGGLTHLKGLANLQVLELNGTRITDQGFVNFAKLRKLHTLLVKSTRIDGSGFQFMKSRRKGAGLKVIEASHTRFGVRGFDNIIGSKTLESLTVVNAFVNDGSLRGLKGCTNLRELRLDNNLKISDPGLQIVGTLKNLEVLSLERNRRVTDATLVMLSKKQKKLRELNLNGTSCSAAGVQQLMKLLDGVKVMYANQVLQ